MIGPEVLFLLYVSQVICKERDGKSGRGVVIQDINAPAAICMERIRDVESYIHVVPHVKKVEVYENRVFSNVIDRRCNDRVIRRDLIYDCCREPPKPVQNSKWV